MNIYKISWPPVRIHDKCDFPKRSRDGIAVEIESYALNSGWGVAPEKG